MAVIEIQTIEGGRLEWVAIYRDTDAARAIEWGDKLLLIARPKPNLRILDRQLGRVIGAWQPEGYEADDS
jgi:hypothetical protein